MSSIVRAKTCSLLTCAARGRPWNGAGDKLSVRTASVTHHRRLSSGEEPPTREEGGRVDGPTAVTEEKHPDAEKEPLPEWPDGVNPETGERDGPKGPEPTRYGDWERKGRVSDF